MNAILLASIFIATACSCAPNIEAPSEKTSCAEESREKRDSPSDGFELHTNGRFVVGKDGRPLIAPVMWNGNLLEFIVDTGAPKTGFDESLKPRLGDAVGKYTMRTSAGLTESELFACPNVTVSGHALNGIGRPQLRLGRNPCVRDGLPLVVNQAEFNIRTAHINADEERALGLRQRCLWRIDGHHDHSM